MDEVRGSHGIAIFASVVMCLTAAASARVQTPATSVSSSNAAAAMATANSATPPKSNSTTAKKGMSSSPQDTVGTHKSVSQSSSAKTGRTSSAASAGHRPRRVSRKSKSARSKSSRARGQQKIDADRATSIQEALIREHYLSGEPSGSWDAESETAMRRYQGDHGWQTKEVPDSRALIKLGLGPSNAHLLNPDSAMTSAPIPPASHPPSPVSHGSSPADTAGTSGDAHPRDQPAAPPQAAPAAQPVPPTPKDAGDSGKPQ